MKSSMRLIRSTTDRVWVSALNWAFAFFESTGCGRNKPSLLQQQQQQSATSYCTAVLHTLTTFQHHDMKTISTTYAVVSAYLSVLRHCWLGDRKDIRPVKSCVLVCWWWFDWSFARLIAPAVITTTCHMGHQFLGVCRDTMTVDLKVVGKRLRNKATLFDQLDNICYI